MNGRTSRPERAVRGDPVIIDDQVLPSGVRISGEYVALTGIALVLTAVFFSGWFSLPGWRAHPVLHVLATLILVYYVGVWAMRWAALKRMRRPRPVTAQTGLRVAAVTTFVPDVEPLALLEMSVKALVALDYPHDTWVLDEGDHAEVKALCDRLGARYFSRSNDPRYCTDSGQFAARTKHGNYNAWLTEIGFERYDYVAAFDPDHVPDRSYLDSLLGYFREPQIAYVQAPQVYYNQRASFIAQGAAEETYAYYSSHQMASYALGHPIVIGSHGLHRVEALKSVCGFPDHDAEDLYLTIKYRADGWRGVYVPRILAMGTTPVDWSGYLAQQMRWARAVLDLKVRVLPTLASSLSRMERFLNLFHGIYYLRPLALCVLYLMLLYLILGDTVPGFLTWRQLSFVGLCVFALQLIDSFRQRFYLDPKHERGFHWRGLILQIAKWPHLVFALVDVIVNRRRPYTVTHKKRSTPGHRVLTPPHLVVAGGVVVAAAARILVSGRLSPVLATLGAVTAAVSLLLAWTETWRYPDPFDPTLLDRRRYQSSELPTSQRVSSPAASASSAPRRHQRASASRSKVAQDGADSGVSP